MIFCSTISCTQSKTVINAVTLPHRIPLALLLTGRQICHDSRRAVMPFLCGLGCCVWYNQTIRVLALSNDGICLACCRTSCLDFRCYYFDRSDLLQYLQNHPHHLRHHCFHGFGGWACSYRELARCHRSPCHSLTKSAYLSCTIAFIVARFMSSP